MGQSAQGMETSREFKYFRDGATLVISLDGLNWLSKRRCSDKGMKKRDEELQSLISSGQMIQGDEALQPLTSFCILDQRGSAAPWLWRNGDRRSSLATRPQAFSSSPRRCRLPVEPTYHSALTSLASFVSECPKEALRTRLILNMQDIFSFIKKDLIIVTQQAAVTTNQHNRFITFCNEDIPLQLFGGTCYTEDCRTSIEDTGWHISDNVFSDLKNSTARWPHGPNTNNSEGIQHELVGRDNFNTCNLKGPLKPCQIYNAPRVLSSRDKNVKKRKSVCFDDDVLVYLFNQDSPTVELHSGPRTSSCTLPDVTLEDSGSILKDYTSDLHVYPINYILCVLKNTTDHFALVQSN